MRESRAAIAAEGIKEEKKKGRETGQCFEVGCAHLQGRWITNETPDIWLLLRQLPMTSAFMFPGCAQETHSGAADGRKERKRRDRLLGPQGGDATRASSLSVRGSILPLGLLTK